jgi:hypothetical protein
MTCFLNEGQKLKVKNSFSVLFFNFCAQNE